MKDKLLERIEYLLKNLRYNCLKDLQDQIIRDSRLKIIEMRVIIQDQKRREHIDSVLSDELTPCPFCGAKGFMESTKAGYYWVRCEEHCCQMYGEWSELEAVEIWNKRIT